MYKARESKNGATSLNQLFTLGNPHTEQVPILPKNYMEEHRKATNLAAHVSDS